MSDLTPTDPALLADICGLIDAARKRVAAAVNSELSVLYWHIGQRIGSDVLHGKRAEYGKQVVATLAQQLTTEYGKGWGKRLLRDCLRLAHVFPDEKIVHTLCAQLSWSHLRLLMLIDNPLKGEMELYLRYLQKYDKIEGENNPVGLILCTGKNEEHVELLQLDQSNIHVAEYLTALPSRDTLEAKLRQSIEIARRRFLAGEDKT